MADYSKLSDAAIQQLSSGKPDYSKFSDDDLHHLSGGEESGGEKPGLLSNALHYGGKALGYAGGVVRTAIEDNPLSMMGKVAFEKNTDFSDAQKQSREDWMRALKGNAVTGDEMLARRGLGEGKHLSEVLPGMYSDTGSEWLKLQKGGVADPSARGAGGLAIDIATDPLTYLPITKVGALAKEALPFLSPGINLMEKAASPISRGLEAAGGAVASGGRKIYNSAFREADAVAKRFGKTLLPSDVFWKHGLTGGSEAMASAADNVIEELMSKRNQLVEMVDNAGGTADVKNALMETRQKIAEFKASKNPAKIDAANAVEKQVNRIENLNSARPAVPGKPAIPGTPEVRDPVSGLVTTPATLEVPAVVGQPAQEAGNLSSILDNKSSLYEKTGKRGYDTLTSNPKGTELLKQAGNDLKRESERIASSVKPGGGAELSGINEELGAILTPRELLERKAMSEIRKPPMTEIDLMALSHSPTLFAAKQIGKAMKSSAAKTVGGKAVNRFGQGIANRGQDFGPILDLLMREKIRQH